MACAQVFNYDGAFSIVAGGPQEDGARRPRPQALCGICGSALQPRAAALARTKEAAKTIQLRGVRISSKGILDSQSITSIEVERLNRLPDTAEEIRTVALVLGADQDNDVYLREQASRNQVRTMTLSDRKVIAFATHALVPGDLNGLDQPALALWPRRLREKRTTGSSP